MNPSGSTRPVQITLVTAAGCHFCDDAQQVLAALAEANPQLAVHTVAATSPEGQTLLTQHRPAMNPLILVDDAYFSAGRLPRRKLQAVLGRRAAGTVAAGVSCG